MAEDLDGFRAHVRTWLAENVPPSLKADPDAVAASHVDGAPISADLALWRKRMGETGWGVPTWPKRYGGGGLSPAEAKVLAEEMRRADARNPIGGLGVMMFGPTLLEYGTEEQKLRHIPGIASFETRWCQGFSEPSAGSDLASLRMKAEDLGDHYLVTGQKIWTTGAHYADWCFALVRTDMAAKKHEGISFLMIDMRSPGVEVRPIRLISGHSSFCETFFTEVKVPRENLVGALGAGWTIAKRLLQHERQNTSGLSGGGGSPLGVGSTVPVEDLARDYVGLGADGRLADGDLRSRLTVHLMEAQVFQLTGQRAMAEARSNTGPSAVSSILKNVGSRLRQDKSELTLELMGAQGLGWEGQDYTPEEITTVRGWLNGKAGSIAGGSEEIQNNIIAKRILGLPDPI